MNPERLSRMQSQVRIGGKGTQRRKKKVVHKTNTDDKKLQNSLKKLAVNSIPGIEEVHMIKDDGHVIHFNNPKVQASLPANTFAIIGHAETKVVTNVVTNVINSDSRDDEDVPDLVGDFDSAATKGDDKKQDKEKAAATAPAAAAATTAAAAAPTAAATATSAAPAVEQENKEEKKQ